MKKLLLKEHFHSKNLFKEMEVLTDTEVKQIYKGLEWTTKNCPNAVVIGGIALVHYLSSSRTLTPDLDFIVDSISSLKNKLLDQNITFRGLQGDNGDVGITVPEFNTDFLSINAGNTAINKLILKTAKKTKIGGYTIKIILPELLAIMKIELGREKDINDGLLLITSKVLNKEIYLEIIHKLKNYLNDYESLLSYAELI